MIFSSASFAVFFLAVMATYILARSPAQRASILLAASVIFYASWKPIYLLLLTISVTANWFAYRRLLRTRSLFLLLAAIAVNLLVLGGFKYLGLAIESALWLFSLSSLDVVVEKPMWINWALPLGISFYTFQMLSALIDGYRGTCKKEVGYRHWCLYVTFFPQLIAGPIVHVSELVDQLEDLHPLNWQDLKIGAFIFAGGLIKKALFADNLGPFVDRLYAHPEALDLAAAWLATVAFGMEIYLDFSGYSEMAIGLARIFGVTLPINFQFPYISRNPSEFWSRWHITLSRWLRDYIYIPMGGNRKGNLTTYRNLFVTMLLGGLWHGANWTFVFWGFLHAMLLVSHRLVTQFFLSYLQSEKLTLIASLLGWPFMFVAVHFTWVFFRAPNFAAAWEICSAMLGIANPSSVAQIRLYECVGVLVTVLLVLLEPRIVHLGRHVGIDKWWNLPFPIRGFAYATLILALVVFGGATQKFIYFDF